MKYVLHGYNVVSPRLGKNGPFDSSFDLYLLCGIVREIGRDDRFIGRSDGSQNGWFTNYWGRDGLGFD